MRRRTRRRTRRGLALVIGAVLLGTGCMGAEREAQAAALTGGHPDRGRTLIRQYGCGSCHTIPGINGANGIVGPPLAGIATRAYIGGVVANSPDNLIRWIRDPKAIDEKTAMPRLGVKPEHARDIAAYLYTLR